MIVQLSHDVGAYMYDVFVARFDLWLAFGIVAQLLFGARFVVQWIASERAGRSIMPLAFWFFSMGGGLMTFVYGSGATRTGHHPRPVAVDPHLYPQPHADLPRTPARPDRIRVGSADASIVDRKTSAVTRPVLTLRCASRRQVAAAATIEARPRSSASDFIKARSSRAAGRRSRRHREPCRHPRP